jgi:hypothetical protein
LFSTRADYVAYKATKETFLESINTPFSSTIAPEVCNIPKDPEQHWYLKNTIFWDVTPCGSCKNRPFGGMYHLCHHLMSLFWCLITSILLLCGCNSYSHTTTHQQDRNKPSKQHIHIRQTKAKQSKQKLQQFPSKRGLQTPDVGQSWPKHVMKALFKRFCYFNKPVLLVSWCITTREHNNMDMMKYNIQN